MKSFILILSFLLHAFQFNLYSQENKDLTMAEKIILDVKEKYAPDKRTSVFTIKAENNEKELKLVGETDKKEAVEELLGELRKKNISFINEIEELPSKDLKGKMYGVITLSVVNIRETGNHSAEMVTQALLGTPVKVLKSKGGWILIQTPDEYIGWVGNSGVKIFERKEFDEWLSAKKIYVEDFFGFSYKYPDPNLERVSDIIKGNIVKYIGEEKEFYKIEYPDGRQAYIQKNRCKDYEEWLATAELTANNLIKDAKEFIGFPYFWGGTSIKGVDCSGLTKTVFYFHGVVIPRDASQQVLEGEAIDTSKALEALQPGDLMFFGRKAEERKKEKITHVALYMGNGEFIHSSGLVRINSFIKDRENYSDVMKTYIRSKRYLNSINKAGITQVKFNKFYRGEF